MIGQSCIRNIPFLNQNINYRQICLQLYSQTDLFQFLLDSSLTFEFNQSFSNRRVISVQKLQQFSKTKLKMVRHKNKKQSYLEIEVTREY
ncbi:unnamed protein product [Paramecium sonneborni]|uniref:Uncharacterized protein n=1 Tax=Paramecium sonneborni TaxID=65129 RepID=A0A8S1P0N5_9CILI|nr:unnamed protein product [Paramecium sonneborni]